MISWYYNHIQISILDSIEINCFSNKKGDVHLTMKIKVKISQLQRGLEASHET